MKSRAAATGGRGNLICAALGASEGFDVVSRFFAPGSGIPEDPADGVGALHHRAVLFQGAGQSRTQLFPGLSGTRGAHHDPDGQRPVKLIGQARTVIEGQFHA